MPLKPCDQLKLLDKIENVIKKMCWKAHLLISGNSNDSIKNEEYGFKTKNSPPLYDDLQNIENKSQCRKIYNI